MFNTRLRFDSNIDHVRVKHVCIRGLSLSKNVLQTRQGCITCYFISSKREVERHSMLINAFVFDSDFSEFSNLCHSAAVLATELCYGLKFRGFHPLLSCALEFRPIERVKLTFSV